MELIEADRERAITLACEAVAYERWGRKEESQKKLDELAELLCVEPHYCEWSERKV